MTQSEVIQKLSLECAVACGDLDHLQTIRKYIEMTLSIGIEHFTKDMEEIVALDRLGREQGRYKSITEAAKKLGLHARNITAVLNGQQHTSGGFIFVRVKNWDLVRRIKNE